MIRKPSYIPWKYYISDTLEMYCDHVIDRINCWQGNHRFKMSSNNCIACGKRL